MLKKNKQKKNSNQFQLSIYKLTLALRPRTHLHTLPSSWTTYQLSDALSLRLGGEVMRGDQRAAAPADHGARVARVGHVQPAQQEQSHQRRAAAAHIVPPTVIGYLLVLDGGSDGTAVVLVSAEHGECVLSATLNKRKNQIPGGQWSLKILYQVIKTKQLVIR